MDFYRPGHSLLHRLDARAKLLLLVPLVACFFLPVPPLVLLPYAIAIIVVVAVFLGPGELLPPLEAIAPVLVFILLLTPPFFRGGGPVLKIGGLTLITADGLRETITRAVRFFGITFGFFAVVRTVSLDDLVLSLRWFGLPYGACLVVIIALRTIPSLAGTWHSVQDAHRLRAGPPAARRRPGLVEKYLPILTSVFIEAIKGIPVLAMALESRGFGRRNPRTSLIELRRGRGLLVDGAVCLAMTVLLIAPVFFRW